MPESALDRTGCIASHEAVISTRKQGIAHARSAVQRQNWAEEWSVTETPIDYGCSALAGADLVKNRSVQTPAAAGFDSQVRIYVGCATP